MKHRMIWILAACLCLLAACGTPAQKDAQPPSGGAEPAVQTGGSAESPPEPAVPSLAEDEEPAYFTCVIVDGAEEGKLLLAEQKDGDYTGNGVYSLGSLDGIQITLDGQPIPASDLRDGMWVTVGCSGIVAESFPAHLGEVYSLAAETVGGTCFDVCGLYLQVLDDLWKKDPALNENITQAAVDLSTAPGMMSESQKAALIWRFGELHGVEAFPATYDELVEEGCITNPSPEEDGPFWEWEDGCLFSIKANEGHDGETYSLPVIFFDAEKWRSSLGAYCFYDCSAGWGQLTTWESYNIGSEMIS